MNSYCGGLFDATQRIESYPRFAGRRVSDITGDLFEAFQRPSFKDYARAVVLKPVVYSFLRVMEGPIADPKERREVTREIWRFIDIRKFARDIKMDRLFPSKKVVTNLLSH
jgi:hypothetical protein